jgi:hypothetical protein
MQKHGWMILHHVIGKIEQLTSRTRQSDPGNYGSDAQDLRGYCARAIGKLFCWHFLFEPVGHAK